MNSLKIVIIDYGIGNIHSVSNALRFLNYNFIVSDNEREIQKADALILPGVGAFDIAMNNLKQRGLDKILDEVVLFYKKPILGICVGMQMLATTSEENGIHSGLDWIHGTVKKLKLSENFAIPHVGWNDVNIKIKTPMFSRNFQDSNFYFDHSYAFDCDEEYIAAYTDYGKNVVAAVQKENIFGVQFHPEKSQNSGLRLFRGLFNSILDHA